MRHLWLPLSFRLHALALTVLCLVGLAIPAQAETLAFDGRI